MPEVEVNDTVVAYERAGSGPPALFCHGERCDRREWAVQREALTDDYEVIAVDLPGHGETSGSDRADLSIAMLTADVREFLRKIGTTPAVIVGRSLGARIAYQLAAHHDDLVSGLVAVNPMPPVLRASSWLRLIAQRLLVGFAPYIGWSRIFSVQRWIQKRDRGNSGGAVIPELQQSLPEYVASAEAMVDNQEYSKLARGLQTERMASAPVRVPFGSIDVPTLGVVGEDASSRVQRTADRLVGVVPDSSKVVSLEDTSRFPQLKARKKFTECLQTFLNSHTNQNV